MIYTEKRILMAVAMAFDSQLSSGDTQELVDKILIEHNLETDGQSIFLGQLIGVVKSIAEKLNVEL